ncbi:MAG: hypothetical protein HY652_04620 [Acidobacteria bacterium]|nr:hypothetical protein [Acidobacteriota bacterium]
MSQNATPHYWRFSAFQRVLHGMVVVSFLGLALTGLPLRYSYTAWALTLSRWTGGFQTAGFLHRVCAVITFLYFGLHLAHIFHRAFVLKEKGLFWGPNSMVPQPKDIRDLYQHVLWFLGRGARPRFERYAYWEKFDYWAVFWGVAIIGASGLFLWFPEPLSTLFPGWVFNVATIVHSEEALLAVAFIFTIHFFNTHLRPEKFPMDPVMFTGRAREEEFAYDHPAEYDRVRKSGDLAKRLAEAPPVWLIKTARGLGFLALAIGLVLIVFIFAASFT